MKDVLITFAQPTHGWWDGGPRKTGQFHGEVVKGGYEGHEELKEHVKWGCWEFNHWERRPMSENSEKDFVKHLRKTMRVPPGNSVKITIVGETL